MKKAVFTFKKSSPFTNSICAIALFAVGVQPGFSQSAKALNASAGVKQKWSISPFDQKAFIENKGQFDRQNAGANTKAPDAVQYGVNDGGTQIYFTSSGLTYKRDEYKELNEEEIKTATRAAAIEEDKDRNVMTKTISHFVYMNWIGANTGVPIVAEDMADDYFTYPDMSDKSGKSGIKANAYKKIIYRNLYPFIDVEYTFPVNKSGIKYALILHPGADASVVKMHYSLASDPVDAESAGMGELTLDENGNIHIKTSYGDIIDHAPLSFYQGGGQINSGFELAGETVSFKLDAQKPIAGQTIVIDPWTMNPSFAMYNAAYDIDYDLQGNVYVYGGESPWQEIKYNSAGVKKWTYTATLLYASGCAGPCYGDFGVDGNSESSYIVEAFNGGTNGCRVIKLNSAGAQIGLFPGNDLFGEMWRIKFNNCTHQAIISGGGTQHTYQACVLDTNVTNMNPVNVLGVSQPYHDIVSLAIDDQSNCFMASAEDAIDLTNADNVLIKVPANSLSPTAYMVADNNNFKEVYSVGYVDNIANKTNGFNGMAVGPKYVYTYNGSLLQQWDKNTGAFINAVTLDTIPFEWGGLEVNACGELYVGSHTFVLHLDTNLVTIDTIPVYNNIYDLRLGPGNMLYTTGLGFVSSTVLPASSCSGLTVSATPDSCGSKGSATVTTHGGVGPFTYKWSNGQTTQTATGLSSGTYTITVSDNGVTPCVIGSTILTSTVLVPGGGGGAGAAAGPDTAVCAGSQVQLNCTTQGSGYQWSPSTGLTNDTIANPVVFALTTTTYTVTVDSGACSGTATVTITVFPSPIAPTITESKTNPDTLLCVDDTLAIKAHQWYFDGNLLPGDTSVSYVATVSGNYAVAVTDTNGCQISVGITIIITGIVNLTSDNTISIYPNPANDQITISASSIHENEPVLVSVTDMLGQIVQSEKVKWGNNAGINIKTLSSGIYFLQLRWGRGTAVQKFIKE